MKKAFYYAMFLIAFGGVALQFWLSRQRGNAIVAETGGSGRATQAIEADGRLARFSTVPEFTLTNRDGQPIRLEDLKGKVWLADFIYTTCPSTCPMLSNRLSSLQKEALAAGDVRLVSFSVDPGHDTPAVLQEYANALGAEKEWLFLTGPMEQIKSIALKGFLLGFEPAPDGTEIIHSTKIALVDRNGAVRRFYDGVGKDEGAAIVADLKKLLSEEP